MMTETFLSWGLSSSWVGTLRHAARDLNIQKQSIIAVAMNNEDYAKQ